MPSWLAALLTPLFTAVAESLIGDLFKWAKAQIAASKSQEVLKQTDAASVKPLVDAKTGDEIDKATDNTLDGF